MRTQTAALFHGQQEIAHVTVPGDGPAAWTGRPEIVEAAKAAMDRATETAPGPREGAGLCLLAYELNGCDLRGPYRTRVEGARPEPAVRDREDHDGSDEGTLF